jgi:hypothetical protein
VFAASAAPTPPKFADTRAGAVAVDVELVIAVDVSYSMDPDEQALQREGYVLALTSKEFLQALRQGAHGKIAVTYFEWAGQSDQKILMPWRVIDGPESADAVAAEISRAPYRRASRTFPVRCVLPSRCSTTVATRGCGASSTCPATEPTMPARLLNSRATMFLPLALRSTACRSC